MYDPNWSGITIVAALTRSFDEVSSVAPLSCLSCWHQDCVCDLTRPEATPWATPPTITPEHLIWSTL